MRTGRSQLIILRELMEHPEGLTAREIGERHPELFAYARNATERKGYILRALNSLGELVEFEVVDSIGTKKWRVRG